MRIMNASNTKIEILKSKFKTVNNDKLKIQRAELILRTKERSITEEISVLFDESQYMLHQIEDYKQQKSSLKYQIAIIELCYESEKSKIDNHIVTLKKHTQAFDDKFEEEQESYESHNRQLRDMEVEKQEVERQQQAKLLEINEQLGAEAARMEDECEIIERECAVLTKRNRAVMLKLRRKLVETESARRELLKQIQNE